MEWTAKAVRLLRSTTDRFGAVFSEGSIMEHAWIAKTTDVLWGFFIKNPAPYVAILIWTLFSVYYLHRAFKNYNRVNPYLLQSIPFVHTAIGLLGTVAGVLVYAWEFDPNPKELLPNFVGLMKGAIASFMFGVIGLTLSLFFRRIIEMTKVKAESRKALENNELWVLKEILAQVKNGAERTGARADASLAILDSVQLALDKALPVLLRQDKAVYDLLDAQAAKSCAEAQALRAELAQGFGTAAPILAAQSAALDRLNRTLDPAEPGSLGADVASLSLHAEQSAAYASRQMELAQTAGAEIHDIKLGVAQANAALASDLPGAVKSVADRTVMLLQAQVETASAIRRDIAGDADALLAKIAELTDLTAGNAKAQAALAASLDQASAELAAAQTGGAQLLDARLKSLTELIGGAGPDAVAKSLKEIRTQNLNLSMAVKDKINAVMGQLRTLQDGVVGRIEPAALALDTLTRSVERMPAALESLPTVRDLNALGDALGSVLGAELSGLSKTAESQLRISGNLAQALYGAGPESVLGLVGTLSAAQAKTFDETRGVAGSVAAVAHNLALNLGAGESSLPARLDALAERQAVLGSELETLAHGLADVVRGETDALSERLSGVLSNLAAAEFERVGEKLRDAADAAKAHSGQVNSLLTGLSESQAALKDLGRRVAELGDSGTGRSGAPADLAVLKSEFDRLLGEQTRSRLLLTDLAQTLDAMDKRGDALAESVRAALGQMDAKTPRTIGLNGLGTQLEALLGRLKELEDVKRVDGKYWREIERMMDSIPIIKDGNALKLREAGDLDADFQARLKQSFANLDKIVKTVLDNAPTRRRGA